MNTVELIDVIARSSAGVHPSSEITIAAPLALMRYSVTVSDMLADTADNVPSSTSSSELTLSQTLKLTKSIPRQTINVGHITDAQVFAFIEYVGTGKVTDIETFAAALAAMEAADYFNYGPFRAWALSRLATLFTSLTVEDIRASLGLSDDGRTPAEREALRQEHVWWTDSQNDK
jgi:hypothetical protein